MPLPSLIAEVREQVYRLILNHESIDSEIANSTLSAAFDLLEREARRLEDNLESAEEDASSSELREIFHDADKQQLQKRIDELEIQLAEATKKTESEPEPQPPE